MALILEMVNRRSRNKTNFLPVTAFVCVLILLPGTRRSIVDPVNWILCVEKNGVCLVKSQHLFSGPSNRKQLRMSLVCDNAS